MKGDLVSKLKKNETIFLAAKFLRYYKDPKFRKAVLNLGKEIDMAKLCRGKGTKREIYYRIKVGSPTIGFFALLKITLNAIAYADYMGLKPVVIYDDNIAYKEKHPINGKDNPFEYYFTQLGNIENAESICEEQAAFLDCIPAHYTQVYKLFNLKEVESYLLEEEHFVFYANIVKKYIQINQYTSMKLNQDIASLLGDNIYIAVHYRGSDFNKNYGNHPVSVSIEDYLEKAKAVKGQYPEYKIFLATDDENCISQFQEAFGKELFFYTDTKRTSGTLSVMCSIDKRKDHHYLLGYEVLRDMITLSKGNILIAGLSQVATFARIFNRSNGRHFEMDCVMNKGINHNSRSHVTDMEKVRNNTIK